MADKMDYLKKYHKDVQIKNSIRVCLGFFGSGAGAYVVIDALNDKDDDAVLWSVSKLPRYNINFWDIVDEWIVIGFQG